MRVRIHIVWLVCWCLGRGAFLAPAAEKLNPPGPTTNIVLPVPPPPPLPKSPVPYFRELLAMSPAQLDQALAAMAEPRRKILQAKLREYAALTAEEREDRLRATELRWYLRPLMEMAPANSTTQIASIPDEYRMLVAERLKQWDALPQSHARSVGTGAH